MRDQRAGRVDDVGEAALLADLDARDDIPDELQVDLGRGDATAAAGGRAIVMYGSVPFLK